jgi:hypothetical protein
VLRDKGRRNATERAGKHRRGRGRKANMQRFPCPARQQAGIHKVGNVIACSMKILFTQLQKPHAEVIGKNPGRFVFGRPAQRVFE